MNGEANRWITVGHQATLATEKSVFFLFFFCEGTGTVKKNPDDSKSLTSKVREFSTKEIAGVMNRKNSPANCSKLNSL
jgi:hypothetical protein